MRALIVALLLAMAGPSLAAEIVVTNGDTFQLYRTIYRLDGIDAPEIDQTYGIKSRDFLRSMCPIGKKAVVHDLGADTYDRRLGRVFCNDIDVNAAMVESGSAWVYDYHATDKSLNSLQSSARSKKRGLWAAGNKPVPPWDFRYQQRRQGNR